jgi:hypothetical protein
VRILWGEWNFGAGSLGVGQHYTPLLFPYSNQVYNIYAMKDGDTNMSTFGMLYGKRKPMVRLKFGNFQIAAVQPSTIVHYDISTTATGTAIGGGRVIPAAQPSSEVKLPQIQAKFKIDFDWGHINLAGGYQTFEIKNTTTQIDYSVRNWLVGIGGRLNVGKAYFKGNLWTGENVGNLADILVGGRIFSTTGNAAASVRDGADTGFARYRDGSVGGTTEGITDNEALASLIVAGYEIRKGLYLEAGYGYTRTELDEASATKLDMKTWYMQSTIFLAPGVFITPEIGGVDGGNDSDFDVFYGGIKWQINF